MVEKYPWQKWSISYIWEHLLVLEHQIPIWLGFILRLSMEFLIFHLYVCKNMNICTNAILSASLDKSMGPSKIT